MERTLFCLLLSMTAGALILHFGQPDRSLASAGDRIGLTAVQETVIHIQSHQDRTGDSSLHFFVDRDGKVSPTDRWISGEQRGMILIGLQTPTSRLVSSKQWQATERLVSQLRQTVNAQAKVTCDDGLRLPASARL